MTDKLAAGADHWYTWRWDTFSQAYPFISFVSITRWRRGWMTLYKLVNVDQSVEWRLYLPFNISLGIQYGGKAP